jgi:hypothetical protein
MLPCDFKYRYSFYDANLTYEILIVLNFYLRLLNICDVILQGRFINFLVILSIISNELRTVQW